MLKCVALAAVWFIACGGEAAPGPTGPTPVPPTETVDAAPVERKAPVKTRGLKEVDVVGTGDKALDLRFQIRAHSGGEVRFIAPGDKLASGDRVEMFVELDRAAHVYVVQFFADKSIAVLFPKGEAKAELAPGRHRIPAAGKMFELDDAVGEEHVYVVASRGPLERVDREVADSVGEVRLSGQATSRANEPKGAKPTKPRRKKKAKLLSLGNRGSSKLSPKATTPGVDAKADTNGVLVFRFWFVHR